MKLSFSSNAFVRHTMFYATERIADIGYEGIEILADVPHLYPFSITANELDSLRFFLDQKGLHVANINANTAMGYYNRSFWEPLFEPSLANPDQTARRWRIDYTKKCLDMAITLGSRNISITSGKMIPGLDPAESMALFQSSLKEILEYAEEKNVRIGIEYEPGLLVECYEDLMNLFEKTDSIYLGVNLDLGHSYVLGEDVCTVINSFSSKIFHIHIEDIKDRKHFHLIPGQGDIDFSAIYHALVGISYEGFISVELYTYPHQPEDAAKRSLKVLKDIGFGTNTKEDLLNGRSSEIRLQF